MLRVAGNLPHDDEAFAAVESSLERSGRFDELLALYETRAREVAAPSEMAQLFSRAGDLALERMRNFPRAESLFRHALVLDPEDRDPLKRLRVLYEQTQDHAALAHVLEQLAMRGSGPERASFFLAAADIYEERLNQTHRAVVCCQLASRADPKRRDAFRRARRVLLQESRYLPAFDSLERERAALGSAGMAEEYVALSERLVDDPSEHALATSSLQVCLTLEPDNLRAHNALRLIRNLAHNWRERILSLNAAAQQNKDPHAAARLCLLIAKIHAFYDRHAKGKVDEALERCFQFWPAMPDAIALIERVAERDGDHKGAANRLERMASEAGDSVAQVDLWLRAGTVRLTRMNDTGRALADFERAAAADPKRADAVSLALDLLLEQGRTADAAALLEGHLPHAADRSAQLSLRLHLAELYTYALRQPNAARAHLAAILKADPSHAGAAFQLAGRVWETPGDSCWATGGRIGYD